MLPEEMWLEWLSDELMLNAIDDSNSILALFNSCFSDYLYEKVCYKYLKYLVKHHQGDSSEVQDGFEFVIRVYG